MKKTEKIKKILLFIYKYEKQNKSKKDGAK